MQRRRSTLNDDDDEVLRFIRSVRKRPALYNYKLAPQDRRRTDVAKGWQDVANEMGGDLLASDCRKKWKNLRDTYHQYRVRKSKFKDCLQKWRYSQHLSFLADIYQPKLKSERTRYLQEHNSSKNSVYKQVQTSNEVSMSSMNSVADIDESTNGSSQRFIEHSLIEHDYEESIEHVDDIDAIQFCNTDVVGDESDDKHPDETYGEVCLYEEGDVNVEIENEERKFEIIEGSGVDGFDTSYSEGHDRVQFITGNKKDELDLFFQFLKTKVQKLPATEITSIQIEFLNTVLRREAANTSNS